MNKMKLKVFAILLVILPSCASLRKNSAEAITELKKEYQRKARELVKSNKEKGDAKKINRLSRDLITIAHPILSSYAEKKPQCKNLLEFIMKNSMKMQSISLKGIEEDYHEGRALPSAPEECYDAKELVVHPATVVIITRDGGELTKKDRAQINDEIEELLAHFELL